MSKASDRWMPFYVADYLADTMHLSTLEHGAYMLLIMHYWRTGPLPNVDEDMARIARVGTDIWADIAPRMRGFFTLRRGRLFHKRIDAEKKRAENYAKKRANSGRKGGLEKSRKYKEKQGDTGGCQDFAKDLLEIGQTPVPVQRERKKESSLRSGGDAPPADAKAALWKEGLAALMRLTGKPRKDAGKMLGKLSDAVGGDHAALLAMIEEAEVKQPDQPFPWLLEGAKARQNGSGAAANGADHHDPWGIGAWMAKQPDVTETTVRGELRKTLNGFVVEHYAERLAGAAGLPESWRGSWDCLGRLLRENNRMIGEESVLKAVHNYAVEVNGAIISMALFEPVIRSATARCAGRRR